MNERERKRKYLEVGTAGFDPTLLTIYLHIKVLAAPTICSDIWWFGLLAYLSK